MSILAVVTEADDIGPLLTWGHRLSTAHKMDFHLIHYQLNPKESKLEPISWDTEAKDDEITEKIREAARSKEPQPIFQRLRHPKPELAILKLLGDFDSKLLLLGLHSKEKSADSQWKAAVQDKAPCDIMILRAAAESGARCDRVLIPISGGPHCRVALRWAKPLTESDDSIISALHVAQDLGEESVALGLRLISKAIKDAGVTPEETILPKVVLAKNVKEGLAKAASDGYDLLLVGASNQGFIRRTLVGTLPDRLLHGPDGIGIAVVRGARPLKERLREKIEDWFEQRIPQLAREDRIDLFERLTESSKANFDFLALTSLATFIAAIGLIQNSGAVVIGAMLVAPLMMPMIAAGLGLAQGNAVLVKDCVRSIGIGFSFAFGISLLCGLFFGSSLPADPITGARLLTAQLDGRVHPGFLDLIVALASGIAAAYANARPNLSSALPGVAIAAALVPPIATGGISLANGFPIEAIEAVTLFGTNLIAIILGASFALWIQGIRANSKFSETRVWAQRGFILLVISALSLSFYLGSHMLAAFH
jgi:uncharacterized hydrophobic protein (TIGR00271 family)